ncbi:hypothetical protein ACH5RR_002150 [Cinchona calisaya]|uniref:Magnesium transporter n=1 Tax=Cinchona calisaya TaxID=153742 RepID=A0ABD3B5H3_9GENT
MPEDLSVMEVHIGNQSTICTGVSMDELISSAKGLDNIGFKVEETMATLPLLVETSNSSIKDLESLQPHLDFERYRNLSNLWEIMHAQPQESQLGDQLQVRDELENLLNDDEDMARMFLSDKHLEWQLENSSISSIDEEIGTDNEVNQSNIGCAGIEQFIVHQERTSNNASYSSTSSYRSKQLHVKDLDMLLEACFIQIDGTLNKLSALREQIDDTEDYVNIMQDDKRNQLLQMVIMVMIATLILEVFSAVGGIFSMNIEIETFNNPDYGMQHFFWMTGCGIAGVLLLCGIAIAWYWHKNLL